MIEEIVKFQAPNKELLATPPPINPAKQLPVLPKCPLPALITLLLQSYRLWAGPSTLHAANQSQGPPLQLPHSFHGPGPGGYVGGTPPGSPIPGIDHHGVSRPLGFLTLAKGNSLKLPKSSTERLRIAKIFNWKAKNCQNLQLKG